MITCKFENGNEAKLRHVVVDGIVLNAARDSVLLVRRAPHLTNGGKYAVIGGFLDRDETTEQAIIREVKEETGYDAQIIQFYKTIDNPNRNEDRQNVSFVFVLEAGKQTGEPDDESTEIRWFKISQLPPEDQFAFDHYENISSYIRSIRK